MVWSNNNVIKRILGTKKRARRAFLKSMSTDISKTRLVSFEATKFQVLPIAIACPFL